MFMGRNPREACHHRNSRYLTAAPHGTLPLSFKSRKADRLKCPVDRGLGTVGGLKISPSAFSVSASQRLSFSPSPLHAYCPEQMVRIQCKLGFAYEAK